MTVKENDSFYKSCGIFTDDLSHKDNLGFHVVEVLKSINYSTDLDIDEWLQKKYFTFVMKSWNYSVNI